MFGHIKESLKIVGIYLFKILPHALIWITIWFLIDQTFGMRWDFREACNFALIYSSVFVGLNLTRDNYLFKKAKKE